jgi:hypothetical protein
MAINLIWKSEQEKYSLCRQGSKVPMLCIVPDKNYPSMWRIQNMDGKLSYLGNLSRVREAAISIAMAEHVSKKTGCGARRGVTERFKYSEGGEMPLNAIRTHNGE